MTIKAVLFDLDGTLVDSNDLHVQVWAQVFADAGRHAETQAIHDQIGKGADKLVPALFADADEAEAERLGEAHGETFKRDHLAEVKPFPHAHDLLARVKESGRTVVLASSASQGELDHYTGLLDAHDIVADATGADDVENTKPAPDIFAAALEKAAPAAPDEVVMVGDSPFDMEGAVRCGIAGVGLRSGGFDDAALREAGAIAIYDDVAALLADFDGSPLAR